MGINVDPTQAQAKNVAAVMVTAKLPPFSRTGSRIDVQASSIGDAKSIEGGTLLMTPLKGPDGKVYAVAQGPISTGGFSASGASGSSVQKNSSDRWIYKRRRAGGKRGPGSVFRIVCA